VNPATRAALGAIVGYQWLISPFIPSACRFAPTCSEYARLALVEHGLLRGIALAAWRLARCHPFHPGGYDPPPARARQV
jgi:putative membrane protein insertion efficiency factor